MNISSKTERGSFRGFENSRNVEVPHHKHDHEPRTRLFSQATTHKCAHAQHDHEQPLVREPTPVAYVSLLRIITLVFIRLGTFRHFENSKRGSQPYELK